MLVKFLIDRAIIYVSIWISNSGISNEFQIIPFAFYDSSFIIGQFSITRKFLSKEGPLILTISDCIIHFSFHSDSILILSLKSVPVIILDISLSIEFIILQFSFQYTSPWYNFFKQRAKFTRTVFSRTRSY